MAKDLTSIEDNGLYEATTRLVPLIKSKLDEIADFINRIPDNYDGVPICSQTRKCYYIRSIDYRCEHFLMPLYDKTVEKGIAQPKDNPHSGKIDI